MAGAWRLLAGMLGGSSLAAVAQPRPQPVPPVTEGRWIRPAADPNAEPVWGIAGGIGVGLWPASGPRGLFRIYAPYLGQRHPRMVNYVSVEPVASGRRGQSELEVGQESRRAGLSMFTADTWTPGQPFTPVAAPARGQIARRDGAEALTFFVATEPFRNGARPVIRVTLREDRPHEVAFRLYAAPESARMDACVLSATMGNYGRLRRVWLNGEVAEAGKVWPQFVPDRLNFAPWRTWKRDRLFRRDCEVIVAATSDEADPASAKYEPGVAPHWRYEGKPATHSWRTMDVPGVVARVNGRVTYWGESGKIPGGIAYENFELQVPFAEGQELRFGVTPEPPERLGFDPMWIKNLTGG